MNGVNLIYSQLSKGLVETIRTSNEHQLLGVWYWAPESSENAAMYMRVFNTCGNIDFFYSDKPIEAMAARDSIYEQCKTHNSNIGADF